uniref:Uncharacterized protein n=1 Tax=Ascaris lumbricoides TaxID=6252 RepID=A0A0M3I4C7_ASCLU
MPAKLGAYKMGVHLLTSSHCYCRCVYSRSGAAADAQSLERCVGDRG